MPKPPVFLFEVKVHLVLLPVDSWRPNILKAEQALYKNLVAAYVLYKMLQPPFF